MQSLTLLRQRARKVHARLLRVYGRPLWRSSLSPIAELISAILSQNTTDLNRDRALTRLQSRFPTWEAVRDAPATSVIAAIRPAGLANQKGPRIQKALQDITQARGTLELDFLRAWPVAEARAWLMRLPGVGFKTASIVLLFSLHRPAFPVDTHVYRVTGRLGLRPATMTADVCHRHLEAIFPRAAYATAHLNLVRLGREVCRARKPACDRCTLAYLCPYPRHKGKG